METMLAWKHVECLHVERILTAVTLISGVDKSKSSIEYQLSGSQQTPTQTTTYLLLSSRISNRILSPLLVASSISILMSSIVSLYFSKASQISSYYSSPSATVCNNRKRSSSYLKVVYQYKVRKEWQDIFNLEQVALLEKFQRRLDVFVILNDMFRNSKPKLLSEDIIFFRFVCVNTRKFNVMILSVNKQ